MITMQGRYDDKVEREIDRFLEHIHEYTIVMDDGSIVRMHGYRVDRTPARPHGLRYSLTLHAPDGRRVLGFDNAHAVRDGSGPARRSRQSPAHDHIDEEGKPSVPYNFTTPFQMLEDFYAAVDRVRGEDT